MAKASPVAIPAAVPVAVPVDLNLLQTFRAVHGARSVSRAAERLGCSQPTVSNALRRLRLLYKDPLFVRTQGGMTPTARADRLNAAVQHALRILDAATREGERYEPVASERSFRLYMSDIGETIFLPLLMKTLATRAPRVRLEAFQLDERDILPALESGRIDLAMGYVPSLASVERQRLLREHYVVLMRAGHPLAKLAPTRATLRRLDYVLVRSHPATARVLAAQGLATNVRLEIPHFMVLPRIVAETDLAVLLPSRLADEFRHLGDYAVWRPKAGPPAFDVSVHWYWRFAGDPGNRWLREMIVSLFREK